MRRILRLHWALCWTLGLLLAFPPTTLIGIGEAHAAAKAKASASQIARGVHQWTGFLAKRAVTAKKPELAKKNKQAVPFWEAVKRLSTASSRLESELTAKRPGYLKALGDARSALTSVRVTYDQSGAKDAQIDKALTNIDRGLTSLEKHAGPANAGKASGKNLNAKQKRQLDALRTKQVELKRKLKEVEARVGKNKSAIRAIKDIRSRSDRIYNSRSTVGDFLAAMMVARVIDGMLWGWHWWWGPWGGWVGPWCGGYIDIYYESLHIVEIDWTIIDAEIAIDDYLLDADLEQVELDAVDAELSGSDFALSDTELDAIADDGFGGETGEPGIETLPVEELSGQEEVLPEIEVLPEPELLPEPDPLPEPMPVPEMEPLPESDPMPEVLPEPEPFAAPEPIDERMPLDHGGGFDGGGFDGGGFDGGGFDGGGFDGGGFDGGGFDGGGFD